MEIILRTIRAIFLLLLFCTSFARCWADTCGLLEKSSLACCEMSSHEEENEHEEENYDCGVCLLIQEGFLNDKADLEIPLLTEGMWLLVDSSFELILRTEHFRNFEDLRYRPPRPDYKSGLSTSRIVISSAVSVRGPNLV